MELIPFVAQSAVDAVDQIRSRLGPDAVVVHVQPRPRRGLSRLWRRAGIDVLAYRPEAGETRLDVRSDAPANPTGLAGPEGAASPAQPASPDQPEPLSTRGSPPGVGWQAGDLLERAGFLPANAQRVVDHLQQLHGLDSNRTLAEELALVRTSLSKLWIRPPALLNDSLRPHVLVGPPGAGKTTVLCKWLTQTVLVENRPAHVWRLDHATANTAETLEVYCQALGVPVDRSWRVNGDPQGVVHFIDLPGTAWRETQLMDELNRQLRSYLSPHVHLVLNAAYETRLLLDQIRSFAALPVEDLILTHLDEESRWGKAWNLVLGTNFPIRFLSAGQNIPGQFHIASPDQLLARQFPA